MGFQLLQISQVRSLEPELVACIPEEGSISFSTYTPESCTVCQSNDETTLSIFALALGQLWMDLTHSLSNPACSGKSTQVPVPQSKSIKPQS